MHHSKKYGLKKIQDLMEVAAKSGGVFSRYVAQDVADGLIDDGDVLISVLRSLADPTLMRLILSKGKGGVRGSKEFFYKSITASIIRKGLPWEDEANWVIE